MSVIQSDPSLTNASTVHYTVTFSEPVTGVNASDFSLATTGVAGASIASVTAVPGDGSQYVVAVDTGSGDGTITLDLTGTAIADLAGNGFSGAAFQPQTMYAAGRFPVSVAIGDVNGDGRPDLVAADYGANAVSVLLGNGDGTFQAQTSYATGSFPQSVAIGDVNGDGRADLVTANANSGTVSVLLGKGDGTFQGQTTYATGSVPYSIAIGDVNGDGRPDLVIADAHVDTVSVLLGNSGGTFQPQTTYATGSGPVSVAIGDVNGDGRPDLVVADLFSDTVSVLLGKGDGSFQSQTAYATGSFPSSVAIGDVNGDGRPDLVVADASPDTVSVLLGNGDGTFQAQSTYATGISPESVAIGDVNGDGRPDLAVADFYSGVSVILNTPPTVAGPTYTIDTTPPAAPGVSLANDTGSSAIDQVTSDGALILTGVEPGALVQYSSGAGGNWSTAAPTYASDGSDDGSHTVEVRQTDMAGNMSAPSSITFMLDTTAPTAPTALSLDASTDSGTKGDGITNYTQIKIDGMAEPGSTVTIYDGSTAVGTGTADATTGAFAITTSVLSADTHSLTAKATDAAGNTGPASTALSVDIATAPPTANIERLVVSEGVTTINITSWLLANDSSPLGALTITDVGSIADKAYQATLVNGQVYLSIAGNLLPGSVASAPDVSFTYTVADTAGNTASATATIKAINDNLKTVNLTTTPLAPYNFSYVAGTGGPDTFAGGSSNDVFVGGGGGDLLNGGGGRDIFLYSAVTDSQPGTGNFDTISGFNTLAKINLSEITGAISPANISSLTSAPASVNANSIVWYYNSTLKQTVVYINPTSSSQKVNSTSIMEINLAGNQTATLGAGNFILPSEPSTEAPTVFVENNSLTVTAGGSVALPINVIAYDSDDKVNVTISGLTSYETITDSLDGKTFSGSSVTLTLAQVNSGLTLNSTYTGTDHPVNTLTVTAKNTAPGEKASSTSQTITVTDPPAGSAPTSVSEIWGGQFDRYPGVFESAFKGNEPSQDGAQVGGPPGLAKVAALFNQFLSAGFPDPAGTSITNVLSQIASNEEQFLTRPHG